MGISRASKIACAMVVVGAHASVGQQTPWALSGTNASLYSMRSTGLATDAAGATLTLRSDSALSPMFGSIAATIPADSFRQRRVRIIADVDTKDVTGGASPWLRVDGPQGGMAMENGLDQPLRGTGTGHREITLYVPATATRIAFGFLMTGKGEATASKLRLEARPAVTANAPIAPAAQRVLDSAIAIARAGSLWRDTVTWARVEPEVRGLAAGAESPSDAYPAIRYLLTALGDHHSFHMRPSGARQFQTGGAQNPSPTIHMLPEGVGYVSVPAYSGADRNAMIAYAKAMHDSITAILPQAGCRWVIDLRANGGGNMWPMLAGLRPFLGEAGLGSFVSARGSAPLWHARDGADLPLSPALVALDSAHVAMLTGPRTASSGEAVTISFRGRPRTRSFGLATAGLSTANQGYTLPDSSMIFLTVSVEADRTGRRYGEKIEPDEMIPAATAGGEDAQMTRAVAWLKAQPGCR